MSSWPALSNALKGSRLTGWLAPVPMRLTHRTVQVISNGDLLCFHNKGSFRRSFDASSQSVASGEYSSLPGFDQKPARSQVRGDVVNHTIPTRSRELTTRGVRVGGPSAGSSGSTMNMTRAEALRTDSYAVRGTIQQHRLDSTPCAPLLGHTLSCVPFSGPSCFLCVPIPGHRCFPLRTCDYAPLTGSPNWCC